MSDDRVVRSFERLTEVMARLRVECPWDRRQDHDSLRRYLLEECYEVLEALDDGDRTALREELGDLIFQVWFHSEIASEAAPDEGFDIADVCDGVADKLVRRHPHVFGDVVVDDASAVKRNWEELKQKEGRESRLDGVPRTLPALLGAQCLQDKAASVGFDWPDIGGVLAKVREEIDELESELEIANPEPERVGQELGDLIFALVNAARHLGVVAEDCVREQNTRFERRFRYIEKRVTESGRRVDGVSLEELDALWEEAKREE